MMEDFGYTALITAFYFKPTLRHSNLKHQNLKEEHKISYAPCPRRGSFGTKGCNSFAFKSKNSYNSVTGM